MLQKFLTGERVIAVGLAVEVDVSGDLGVGETVVEQGRGCVDILDQSVADKGYTESTAGDVIRRHLLVKTEKDIWREPMLSEKLRGALSGVVLGVKKDKWAVGKCFEIYRTAIL